MARPRQTKAKESGDLAGARILVVEARFYEDISDALLDGARRALDAAQVVYDVITVPGALEIPAAIAMALETGKRNRKPYDGVVALGCVIRGETSHYDIVANESARAIMDMSITRALPIGNGILTVDTEAQAWARAKADDLDKGGGAARAALAMVRLKRSHAKPPRGARS